jgi:cytochrome c biogenesis protein CcmG, thiol:disulfide interchange protein DsbE
MFYITTIKTFMKLFKFVLFTAIIILGSSFTLNNNPFPSINIKTLDGKEINTSSFSKSGKITLVSFWATWCTPCKAELDVVNDVYADWKAKYDMEVVAITIDDARGLTKVPGMVQNKGWEFTVLADSKQELMQSLSFQTIPQTFLIDQNGNIVYAHNGYKPGDEIELEEKIAALKK